MAEEFRHIKRPILRNMRGRKGEGRMSQVMVTSALPGEGKTFCAINLAMSLALEIDLSVILIDAGRAETWRPEAVGTSSPQGAAGPADRRKAGHCRCAARHERAEAVACLCRNIQPSVCRSCWTALR
jgi:Mrp family chromosome partitioning ATPase